MAHFMFSGDVLFKRELTPHVISSIPAVMVLISEALTGVKLETKAENTSVISNISSIPPITENKTTYPPTRITASQEF